MISTLNNNDNKILLNSLESFKCLRMSGFYSFPYYLVISLNWQDNKNNMIKLRRQRSAILKENYLGQEIKTINYEK